MLRQKYKGRALCVQMAIICIFSNQQLVFGSMQVCARVELTSNTLVYFDS